MKRLVTSKSQDKTLDRTLDKGLLTATMEAWCVQREFLIDNLLVRIHFVIVMIR